MTTARASAWTRATYTLRFQQIWKACHVLVWGLFEKSPRSLLRRVSHPKAEKRLENQACMKWGGGCSAWTSQFCLLCATVFPGDDARSQWRRLSVKPVREIFPFFTKMSEMLGYIMQRHFWDQVAECGGSRGPPYGAEQVACSVQLRVGVGGARSPAESQARVSGEVFSPLQQRGLG